MTRRLAREEGIFAGISSGGAMWRGAAGRAEVENAVIVSIVCDRGDRYLSTGVFPDERDARSSSFDIETVPDTAGLRKLYSLSARCPDTEVAEMAFQRRRQTWATTFFPCISIESSRSLARCGSATAFACGRLASQARRAQLIQRFFDGIEQFSPQLVSWNGGGFDLPVLNYRGMLHGVHAARYWELGDDDREFRYNNYIGRYHTRHLDLMDLLGMYQARVPLDEFAQMLGLPGKIGMHGSAVWDAYCAGRLDSIRSYCEADVANTYCLFLRFQLMRGLLSEERIRKSASSFARHSAACPARTGRRFSRMEQLNPQDGPRIVTIESLDQEGRGVAHWQGKAIFVDGALPGETVEFSSYRRKPSYEFAQTSRILRDSAQRVVAGMPAFRHLRRLHAATPGRARTGRSEATDTRGRALAYWPRPAGSDAAAHLWPDWEYRHRARLTVRNVPKKGGILVGFHERRRSYVADMTSCAVMPRRISRLLPLLRELVSELSVADRLPQIEVACADDLDALVLRILRPLTSADESGSAAVCRTAQRCDLSAEWRSGDGEALPSAGVARSELSNPRIRCDDEFLADAVHSGQSRDQSGAGGTSRPPAGAGERASASPTCFAAWAISVLPSPAAGSMWSGSRDWKPWWSAQMTTRDATA